MSGIIAYAKVTVVGGKRGGESTIHKPKKQSDRKFIKEVKRFLATNKESTKNIMKKEITLKKTEIRYYDRAEADITQKIRVLYV